MISDIALAAPMQYTTKEEDKNMKKLAEGGTLTPEDKQAPVEFWDARNLGSLHPQFPGKHRVF